MITNHTPAPCPFCGSLTALEIQHLNYPGDRRVICNFKNGGCGASTGSGDSDIKAIKNWNKRANAKFTPAPWLIYKRADALYDIDAESYIDENGEEITDVICETVSLENVNLIAAARELLDALEGFLDANSKGTMWSVAEATSKANDAIAKATQ